MTFTRLLILLACLTFLPAATALGASDSNVSGDIVIKADTMTHNQVDDSVNASGKVVMEWEGAMMTADRASYNRATRILSASGNIIFTKGEDVLRGESLTLDMASGRGELLQGSVTIQPLNATITGSRITRIDDSNLVISETELTTCDLPNPSWKLGANKLKVNLLGYAIGKNLIFYIKDKPVMFIPWIAFPVVREKKSGLLFPRLGYSNKRGAQTDFPIYWVISPSQDATFDIDIQTKRGVGIGADYRYLRKRGSEGHFGGYLIYDLLDSRWRGEFNLTHKEIFSSDMNLRTSLDLTSDRQFLSDFGEKVGDYNRQSDDSTVNFLKTWQNYALSANMRYTQDYYASNNSLTLQTLPEIGLSAVRQRLFATPLFFDMDASAANLYRETGTRGQRVEVFPRLTLVSGLPGSLHASVYGGIHLRGYNTSNIPEGSTTKQNEGSLLPEMGVTVATSLNRIYDVDGKVLKKLRHELTPEIVYRYVTNQDQSRLPSYDFDDRLVHQNIVYYGLTSHLEGKFQSGETTEYRDISRIRLMQGYSFSGTRRDLLTLADANRPLTDLILDSETWLNPHAGLTFDARYDFYDNRFSSAAPGVTFDDKRGTTASASYRMSRNTAIPLNQVEYFEGRISTKLFKPWTFSYTTRYSFDRGGFLETVYSVEYRHQCWSMLAAFHDRAGNPSFSVNFNLAGLTTGSTR